MVVEVNVSDYKTRVVKPHTMYTSNAIESKLESALNQGFISYYPLDIAALSVSK